MATAEINIRGMGIFGLSVAWACVRRGAQVWMIDPSPPEARTSGGIVGALSPHVPENWNEKKAFQLQSLLMAGPYWDEVCAVSGLPSGYCRHGRLQTLIDDRAVALAQARAQGAEELWQGKAAWSVVPARAVPWSPPSPTGLIVHDTLSAHIHPRRAIAALTAAILARGGRHVSAPRPGIPTLWAIGADDPLVTGVKGQAALLDHDARGLPQIFVDGLHIIPHADGTTAVGSTSERQWTSPGTDDLLNGILERARASMPVLEKAAVLERWAGVRPRAASRAPLLGPHPDRPGDFIANGGFKIGFGMAPLVGEVMADLVLDGRDDGIPGEFRT